MNKEFFYVVFPERVDNVIFSTTHLECAYTYAKSLARTFNEDMYIYDAVTNCRLETVCPNEEDEIRFAA